MKKRGHKLPKISFVLLTYNGGVGVKECLNSFRSQVYPKSLVEIIVIDNGSSDESVNYAKNYTKNVFVSKKTETVSP